MRADIDARLGNDPGKLPDHISLKIGERLNTAARKNPTLDETHYEQLIGMLQYADLRELEAAITNKTNWPLFADRFSSKEQLANRFGQLAELRNGIRHSRAVGEVARMDGEAAITWFSNTLGLT